MVVEVNSSKKKTEEHTRQIFTQIIGELTKMVTTKVYSVFIDKCEVYKGKRVDDENRIEITERVIPMTSAEGVITLYLDMVDSLNRELVYSKADIKLLYKTTHFDIWGGTG